MPPVAKRSFTAFTAHASRSPFQPDPNGANVTGMTAGNTSATRLTYRDFPMIRAWSGTYRATADQVRQTRRGLSSFLGDSPLTADAVTCLSELVANSIEHSNSRRPGGQVTVRATLTTGRLRVEVEDQGGPWRQPAANADSPRGRGLRIVGALSRDWGKTGDGALSRTVWFEMGASLATADTPPSSPAERRSHGVKTPPVPPPCCGR
jgi:hypothetical protein